MTMDLQNLEKQEQTLRFSGLHYDFAWKLGCFLRQRASDAGHPMAILIDSHGHVLFHCSLPGAAPDNDHWLLGKSRLVHRFGHSSMYMKLYLEQRKKNLQRDFFLESGEYRVAGGSFPILNQEGLVLGAVTVSGLSGSEDHQFVVDAVSEWVGTPQLDQE